MERRTGPAAAGLRLRLLDRFGLEYGARRIEVAGSGQRLLALLALRGTVSRTVVAGTLWPEVTEEHALGSLRTALWRLHRGRRKLIVNADGSLALEPGVSVDVCEFTEAALNVVHDARGVPPTGVLGGGELLPGWDEDWVVIERERLRQLRMHALEVLARHLMRARRFTLALEAALTSSRIEPLRESAHRTIVAVHLAEGNFVEAIRHYERFRALMYDELGVSPSRQFTEMLPHRLARARDAVLTAR